MKDIYDKISKIIGDLIVYGNAYGICNLVFYEDKLQFTIKDSNNNSKPIDIEYSTLSKLHDYKLENFIITLIMNNG